MIHEVFLLVCVNDFGALLMGVEGTKTSAGKKDRLRHEGSRCFRHNRTENEMAKTEINNQEFLKLKALSLFNTCINFFLKDGLIFKKARIYVVQTVFGGNCNA